MEHHHLFRGKINYKGAIFNSKLFNYQRIKLTKQNWGLGTWGYPSNLDVESLILDRNQWNSDTWGDARELNPTYLLVNYHKFGKSHFFQGKTHYTWPFSMAMWNRRYFLKLKTGLGPSSDAAGLSRFHWIPIRNSPTKNHPWWLSAAFLVQKGAWLVPHGFWKFRFNAAWANDNVSLCPSHIRWQNQDSNELVNMHVTTRSRMRTVFSA